MYSRLIFGLPPSLKEPLQGSLSAELAALLAEHLGALVELRTLASYVELSDQLAEGRLDFAWLPPLPAHHLDQHCGAELLVQAERGGQGAYHGVLFCPAGSALRELADLQGEPVAFVGRRSVSGYLAAAGLLARHGVAPAEPALFVGSHAKVIAAVESGAATAGATFATYAGDPAAGHLLISGWMQAAGLAPDAFRVLAWAGPIPADTVCAWPGTSMELRAQLVSVLLRLHESSAGKRLLAELFGATRFGPVDPRDFATLDATLATLAATGAPASRGGTSGEGTELR